MSVFRGTKLLEDVGREHLERCNRVAANTTDLNAAISEAVRSLSAGDLRRASATQETAAEFLSAPMNAALTHSSHSVVGSYIFYFSVFSTAVADGLSGDLVSAAGHFSAMYLEEMLLMALRSGHYGFIRGGGEMLDRIGYLLGAAFYQVSARSFQLLVHTHEKKTSLSESAALVNEIETARLQREMRQLIPLARQQCDGDETKMTRLHQCEQLLKA